MLEAEMPLGQRQPSPEGWRGFSFSCVRAEKGGPGEGICARSELCHSWECRQSNKGERKSRVLMGGPTDFTTRDWDIELGLVENSRGRK